MTYPAHPPHYMPAPRGMPGPAVAAVTLLWVLLGMGVFGSIVFPAYVFLGVPLAQGSLVPGYMTVALGSALLLIVWSVLRAICAVKIKQRSRGARIAAIILEVTGLILTVLTWIVVNEIHNRAAVFGTETTPMDPAGINCSALGVLPSLLVIVLLSIADSKRWCDR